MNYPHTLVSWNADAIAGWEREAPTPADGAAARIALVGPPSPAGGAREVIPSWSAETPPGAWIEVQLRARFDERWSRWCRVARWDGAVSGSRRTSFPPQADDDGRLATDTLLLNAPAEAVQARALLCAEPGADMPAIERLTLCLSRPTPVPAPEPAGYPPSAIRLPLLLSQYLYDPRSPWCSPTCVVMALAHWHERTGEPRLAPFLAPESVPAIAAPMIHDPAWKGTGNWAFNTAFAASRGLCAYVTRFHSLEQAARWTAAGVPVILSVAWEEGEIAGAVGRTSGHLTLVRGFAGDQALIAEPASPLHTPIERAYNAAQLSRNWQRASQGTVYLIHPPGWPRPNPGPGDAWV